MIAKLSGRLLDKTPSHVIVDVHGVGYEVHIALTTYFALPDVAAPVSFEIVTNLRSDSLQLFGFLTAQEKRVFGLLTGITGIGPKLALSVLSTLSVKDLVAAVQRGDIDSLSSTPGVGRKSASRIVLELKDTIAKLVAPDAAPDQAPPADSLQEDACSALSNLGYKPADVRKAIQRSVDELEEPPTLEAVIRESLKRLAKT